MREKRSSRGGKAGGRRGEEGKRERERGGGVGRKWERRGAQEENRRSDRKCHRGAS